jgi:hypothetical protein
VGDDAIARYSLFAVYDLAVSKWAQDILKRVTNHGLLVLASPMRAFSEAQRVIERNTPADQKANLGISEKVPNVPLPLISVQRGGVEPRDGRTLRKTIKMGMTDNTGRQIKVSKPPLPLWLNYEIEIWSKTINIQSQLLTEYISSFDPHLSYGTAVWGEPWGNIPMAIRLNSLEDVSSLEGEEMGDRVLRHNLSVRIEAWKFNVVEEALGVLKTGYGVGFEWSPDTVFYDNPHFTEFFFQSDKDQWYRVSSLNKGDLAILPCSPPSLPLQFNSGKKNVVLNGGVLLPDSDSGKTFNFSFNHQRQGHELLDVKYTPTTKIVDTPLAVTKDQKLFIGGLDGTTFGQLLFHRFGPVVLEKTVL